MGSGFIFFIRTLLPTLGNPSLITLLFQGLSLLFMFTNRSFKTLYKGNYILFLSFSLFMLYATIFFVLKNGEPGYKYMNILYLTLSTIYLILLHQLDYSLSKYLLKSILILTCLINLGLIYSIATNPYYVIGMRATVSFASNDSNVFTGNPHIYARNALNSLIVSLIFLFRYKESKLLSYVFYWICFLLSIAVLFLTLVKTAIVIAPFIIILIFFSNKGIYDNSKLMKENSTKRLKIVSSLVILLILMFSFNLNKLIDLLNNYGNIGINLLNNSINTILGSSAEGNSVVDSSTLTRVQNLNYVKDLFTNHPMFFIFGNGFRYFYVDVPIVELFLNFGVIGLGLYCFWLFLLYFFSFKNISENQDSFQLFISVYIISTTVSLFTQGRPMEYGTYIHAAFFIRFLYTHKLTNR